MRQRRGAGAASTPSAPTPTPAAAAQAARPTVALLVAALRQPVPAAPLLVFRSCWACCVAKELYDELPRLPSQYGPSTFNFKYHMLAVETPTLETIHAVFGLLFVALGYLAASPWLASPRCGCRLPHWVGRGACVCVLCGYSYVFLLEAQRYNNHYYLSILIPAWLSLAPLRAGSSGSGGSKHLTVPRWQLEALRWQIAAVYFFGGVAKLSDDWLSGATWYSLGTSSEHGSAATLITTASDLLREVDAPDGWRSERAAAQLLSWGGAAFDLGVGPLLLAPSRPFVWLGVLVATVFHVSNLLSFTIGAPPSRLLVALHRPQHSPHSIAHRKTRQVADKTHLSVASPYVLSFSARSLPPSASVCGGCVWGSIAPSCALQVCSRLQCYAPVCSTWASRPRH